MLKKIKSLSVSDNTFQVHGKDMHHVNVIFEDGLEAYCMTTTNPPWYSIGDTVQVIMKGEKTKGDSPKEKISIKKPDDEQRGGGGGGYKGKSGGGGSRGGNESFALSYSKDLAVALINKDIITNMDDALAEVDKGFHALLPLLSPAQPQKKVDPKWEAVNKAINEHSLQSDIKKLGWKKSDCIREHEAAGNDNTFADNVRRMANPPQEPDVPAEFDEYEDDIPF